MAKNSNLLQEAIADAKQVRSTAIESAKAALEEAFSPRLNSIFSQRIAEMDMEDEEEEDLEDLGLAMDESDEDEAEDQLADVGDELEDVADELDDLEDDGDEGEDVEIEADDFEEEEDDLDLESVIRELEMDLTEEDDEDYMADDEVEDVEDEIEDVTDELDDVEDELTDESFEIDLDELMREIEDLDVGDEAEVDLDDLTAENARLRAENEEYRAAVSELKENLQEVNLLNAKLLYTTKVFRNYNLTNEQKLKVLESFDRATNVRDVKLVYTTLGESLRFGGVSKKTRITEGLVSQATGDTRSKTGADEKILSENTLVSRMQQLAGIRNNKKQK